MNLTISKIIPAKEGDDGHKLGQTFKVILSDGRELTAFTKFQVIPRSASDYEELVLYLPAGCIEISPDLLPLGSVPILAKAEKMEDDQ